MKLCQTLIIVAAYSSWLTPAAMLYAAESPQPVTVDARSESAIRGALRYLASKQDASGAWSSGSGERHEVAITGYVLLAFMAAGQVPDEGEYGRIVTKGVNFLLGAVKPSGFIQYGTTNMYGHGIATIALAEAYGQSREPRIKSSLESAVKLIISAQSLEGGWRYEPRPDDADISVTVLQVVALRAAKNSGLDVPQATIDRAIRYVRSCNDQRSGGFTYQPRNNDPGFARTAAAIYSLQVCGQYDDPLVARGSQYLVDHKDEPLWFTYGQFYAAPAQYMIGGDTWDEWYRGISQKLLSAARSEGEMTWWEPKYDRERSIGPVWCTAVYTTILAMPYHYLPLYQR